MGFDPILAFGCVVLLDNFWESILKGAFVCEVQPYPSNLVLWSGRRPRRALAKGPSQSTGKNQMPKALPMASISITEFSIT